MTPNTGRASGDVNSDDYVAQVLAREARNNSLKYSTQGLGAYLPKRPTGAAPKPNTRFLRHIIKETDNHNAALKRKEERDARARMRQLRDQAAHDSKRSRHHRQPTSDNRDSRRERKDDRSERYRSHRRRHRSRSTSADRERSSTHTFKTSEVKGSWHKSFRRTRSRSPSPRKSRDIDFRSRHRHYRRRSSSLSRPRSRSPRVHESREDIYNERSHRHLPHDHESSRKHETTDTRKESSSFLTPTPQDGGESDPLEDLVGPLPPKEDGFGSSPPIRSRGRGAYKPNSSNIDAHFAPDYDPSLDVQLEEAGPSTKNTSFRRPVSGLMTEDDDWELALEALHDRARWRQKGEERLREAGFNDSFVERWKSNTTSATAHDSEGRLEDVKWSKKGEGREWDRGKFVDKEGHIDVKASW